MKRLTINTSKGQAKVIELRKRIASKGFTPPKLRSKQAREAEKHASHSIQ